MHKVLSIFFLIITFLFSQRPASACTIFYCCRGDKVLVGNNEDWKYNTDVEIWFVSSSKNNYGRVCLGWKQLYIFRQAQGGMNDQGLFFDWAMCPESEPPKFSFNKKIAAFNLPENLLAQCATVEEAVAWLKKYNILGIRSHILLGDKGGNSAVVEWVNGEMNVLQRQNDCQVMTNFWLSHPELGNYPCSRYDKVTEMLKHENVISVDYFKSILELVSTYERDEKGEESGTIYSNIYDLVRGDIYIYYKRNFENSIKINLVTELKKGKHTYKLRRLLRR